MRTTSLRLRVIAAVLIVLTIVLLTAGILINLVLGAQLGADLQQRLLDRAGYAQILAGQGLPAQDLANQLTGDGVTVTYQVGGTTVYGRQNPTTGGSKPPKPAHQTSAVPGAVLTHTGDQVTATQTVAGGTLTLSTSQTAIDQTLSRLRTIEVGAAAATLLVTGLLLTAVVAVALRPLTRMTALAVAITRGGRGGRLRPSNPRTELGRTASAFDDMLHALETAETTAQTAAAAAAAAEDRMWQLLADVSHELRTPVAGLQASAETLLRDNPARTERERLVVAMIHETHRTARLVGDLVLMTRLDQGEVTGQLLHQPVNLTAITTGVVTEQRLLAPDQHLDLHTAPEVWVHGDPQRLTQILTNLLDNARHATPPGGHIITTLAVAADAAQLEVTDTGPGVPPADRDRIFERFVRLDPARTRHHGGSGLGLPIARALARAHGGTLTCIASAAGGRFTLTLPTRSTPAAIATDTATATACNDTVGANSGASSTTTPLDLEDTSADTAT